MEGGAWHVWFRQIIQLPEGDVDPQVAAVINLGDLDMLPFCQLRLMDNDTLTDMTFLAGRMEPRKLKRNTKGYTLMGLSHLCRTQSICGSTFKVSISSTEPGVTATEALHTRVEKFQVTLAALLVVLVVLLVCENPRGSAPSPPLSSLLTRCHVCPSLSRFIREPTSSTSSWFSAGTPSTACPRRPSLCLWLRCLPSPRNPTGDAQMHEPFVCPGPCPLLFLLCLSQPCSPLLTLVLPSPTLSPGPAPPLNLALPFPFLPFPSLSFPFLPLPILPFLPFRLPFPVLPCPMPLPCPCLSTIEQASAAAYPDSRHCPSFCCNAGLVMQLLKVSAKDGKPDEIVWGNNEEEVARWAAYDRIMVPAVALPPLEPGHLYVVQVTAHATTPLRSLVSSCPLIAGTHAREVQLPKLLQLVSPCSSRWIQELCPSRPSMLERSLGRKSIGSCRCASPMLRLNALFSGVPLTVIPGNHCSW